MEIDYISQLDYMKRRLSGEGAGLPARGQHALALGLLISLAPQGAAPLL